MSPCPLIETYAQAVTDGSLFVQEGESGGFTFRSSPFQLRRPTRLESDDGARYLHYGARLWEKSETVNCLWEMGAVNEHFGKAPPLATHRRPVHFHASFQISNKRVHIDFVRRVSSGPLSGTLMYYVFVEGRLAQRGGEFAFPPGSMRRCWPLAIRVDRRVLVIDAFLPWKDSLTEFEGVSLWKRVNLADFCPSDVNYPEQLHEMKSTVRKVLEERFPRFYHSESRSPSDFDAAIDRFARKNMNAT